MLLLKSSPRSRPKQPALPRRRPQKLRRTRTRKGSNNGKSTSHSIRTQHPVLPEPVHLDLVVEDETVVDVLPQIGFIHRGLEKLVETRDIHQYIYVAERICGICAFGHSYGYAQTVERLMNVEIPPRAEYLRAIMHELSRIHSHLLWMGLAADAFGFESLFMHSWRLRERILDIFEAVAGGRVILSYTLIGGVTKDIDAPMLQAIKDKLASIKDEYKQICNAFLKDTSVKNRLVGVGYIAPEDAFGYGMVGPFARASNLNNDVRCLGIGAYGDLANSSRSSQPMAIAMPAFRCAPKRCCSPSISSMN